MKKLFTFSKKMEAHQTLRLFAKIFKVFHIVSAGIFALFCIIGGIQSLNEYGGFVMFILALLLGAVGFFIIVLMGWFVEVVILGFSNVVENNYEELVLKNKVDEPTHEDKDFYNRLKQLQDLKTSGIISQEEFEKKKIEALKSI